MRVCFARSGAPTSAGRDGTIRTYSVQPALDATDTSARAAGSALDGQAANGSTTHDADVSPTGDGPPAEPCSDDDAAVFEVSNGPGNGLSNSVPAPQQKRPQLLTCIAVEAVPGMSAPVVDVTAAGAHGSEERLVCGFQVRVPRLPAQPQLCSITHDSSRLRHLSCSTGTHATSLTFSLPPFNGDSMITPTSNNARSLSQGSSRSSTCHPHVNHELLPKHRILTFLINKLHLEQSLHQL